MREGVDEEVEVEGDIERVRSVNHCEWVGDVVVVVMGGVLLLPLP